MNERTVNNVVILSPKGYLTGTNEVALFQQRIQGLLGTAKPYVLVDLSAVEHLNSDMIGILLHAHHDSGRIGGRLAVCCVPPRVMRIFTMFKLGSYMDIYPTEGEALASFEDQGGEAS